MMCPRFGSSSVKDREKRLAEVSDLRKLCKNRLDKLNWRPHEVATKSAKRVQIYP
jgi:hypothetical protein